MSPAVAAPNEEHQPHIKGIMLPSGDVLFSKAGSRECPWCQLIDMQGCFMHLTCAGTASRPATKRSSLLSSAAADQALRLPRHKKTAPSRRPGSG